MSGDEREVSRIYSQKVDRRFHRDFGRFLGKRHRSENPGETKDESEQSAHSLKIKLIEAKEEVDSLRRKLNSKDVEIEQLKRAENASKIKVEQLKEQLSEVEAAFEKEKHKDGDYSFALDKTEEKLLLEDYRTALSKYKTWLAFAEKQKQEMKVVLEEVGGWTEATRYRIYFAYRAHAPETVTDEIVTQLATGSIVDYPGSIENIEGITATESRAKFHSSFSQTDEPPCSSPANEFPKPKSPPRSQMSVHEVRLLEYEQQIQRLEIQNAQMHEQLIILSERSKHMELLEEQKDDLNLQLSIRNRQNVKLMEEQEQLKSNFFGGGAASRNSNEEMLQTMKNLEAKNEELSKKLQQFEQKKEKLTLVESKRIALILKQKYEREIAALRSKLDKYERTSDTTRIYRFVQQNPLDEAHDELLVKQVASEAAAAAKSTNSLKRRKLDEDGDTVGVEGNISDITFLAEEGGENEEAEEEEGAEEYSVKLRELRLQLDNVKQRLEQNERAHSEHLAQYRELVILLSGYDVRLCEDDEFCEAENVLSKDSTFVFRKLLQQPPVEGAAGTSAQSAAAVSAAAVPLAVDLMNTESTQRWRDVVENYLIRYQSVPAFLSAVTISLVESPETPGSSRQSSSSIEEITSSQNSENEAEE